MGINPPLATDEFSRWRASEIGGLESSERKGAEKGKSLRILKNPRK
jgi:hypothetical protein